MASLLGMTRTIVIAVTALAAGIPTASPTMMLTDGGAASEPSSAPEEATALEEREEDSEASLLPALKPTKTKPRERSLEFLSLFDKKKNKNLLSLIWGGFANAPPGLPEDVDEYREDKERIRETLEKFYKLADPKFAKASLASVRRKRQQKLLAGNSGGERMEQEAREGLDDKEDDDGRLLPGTVLQTYRSRGNRLPGLDPYEWDLEGKADEEADEGSDDDSLLESHAYELVERMQRELGATPKHYMDFAYRSVTSSSSGFPSSFASSKKRKGSEDLWLSSIDDENLEEDASSSCKAIIPTSTSKSKVEEDEEHCIASKDNDHSSNNNNNNNSEATNDRAITAFFSSWWKWWLPFANSQWWKNYGSSKADYDIGDSPFAGGSNGEVWRGRRVCRPNHRRGKRARGGSSRNNDSVGNPDGTPKSHRAFLKRDENTEKEGEFRAGEGLSGKEEPFENMEDCDDQTPLVLKRLRIERGYMLLEAGLREIYFGKLISRVLEDTKQNMYTVYVDHFFREVPRAFDNRRKDLELWIVYEYAGPSLRSYIYTPIVSESGFVMHQHSKLWTKLRTFADGEESENDPESEEDSSVEFKIETEDSEEPSSAPMTPKEKKKLDQKIGKLFMQKTLREILAAAAELHKRGIVHRDIKPSNVMCQSEETLTFEEFFDEFESSSDNSLPNIVCKLGDFSSGWDRYTSEHLYSKGPTPGEQTDEYAPPESYVGPYWKPFDEDRKQTYDSWSIGVLALELLLGTPNVFSVDQRTSALLTNKLQRARASDDEIAYALYLAALSNFCIFVPSSNNSSSNSDLDDSSWWPLRYGDPLHKTAMVKESCTLQDFHRALRARDPLGIGFDSSTDLLLHLIWQLLAFDPSERMTAEEALRHPYFISPDGTLDSLHQIPGYHNALISEMLDAGLIDDFDIEDEIKSFQCPTCGRIFHDWRSCHQHANLRKHAKFCVYNHTVLPSCINTHSMLPEHPTSGYCDLQGRRKTIEDFHSIHLQHGHQFYGIFDGHTGNLAAKFAASELYTELLAQLPNLMHIEEKKNKSDSNTTIDKNDGGWRSWKEDIRTNVTKAFEIVHERFLDRIATMTTPISEVGSAPKMDQSGTTATALLVTEDVLVAAVLGDSRGVLASAKVQNYSSASSSGRGSRGKWKNFPEVSAIAFSIDHVAADPTEEELVIQRGGFVSKTSGMARVNGTLAITRSIGDANLAPILSREPHVRVFDRTELREICGNLGKNLSPPDSIVDDEQSSNNDRPTIPCFAILASDGLWDVMSNQEAVDMVVEIFLKHNEAHASFPLEKKTQEMALLLSRNVNSIEGGEDEGSGGPFQESAERLAVEAYVRGSTDNIGVCVVSID